MANDIAPALLEKVSAAFDALTASDPTLSRLQARIESGKGTYADAQAFATRAGGLLSEALRRNVSSDDLPDGRMYYNIADRLLTPLLTSDHDLVANAAAQVQQTLNEAAGIGMQAVRPALNTDRIRGLVDEVSNAERYDNVSARLYGQVTNFSQNVVDESVRVNADAQFGAGMSPKIVRIAAANCCDWCAELAGTYEYSDVKATGNDVWRRHANCGCLIEYEPHRGRRETVQNYREGTSRRVEDDLYRSGRSPEQIEARKAELQKLTSDRQAGKIEARQAVTAPDDRFSVSSFAETVRQYTNVDSAYVYERAKNGGVHAGIIRESEAKTPAQLRKSIRSRTAQVELHADKIANPQNYIPDWASKTDLEQQGLLRKWEKDMNRNAEQAEIELAVWNERFGR